MAVLEEDQKTLFDLSGKEIDPNWVDPKQKLKIPNQPLHVKGHRLQLLLERLDNQASRNAAQFNSANYLAILNEYIATVEQIKEGKSVHELLDEGALGTGRESRAAAANSDLRAISMGVGVPTPNTPAG